MKHMMRKLLVLLSVLGLCVGMALPALANSAQTRWSGVDAKGLVVTEEDCPIVVERERLVFDVSAFPEGHYASQAAFEGYDATVTAEYSFYNPADYAVTATLLFPYGTAPDYAPSSGFDQSSSCGIMVGEEPVSPRLRYSYYRGGFDLEKDLGQLHEGYVDDDFYSPELPVTKYTYTASGLDEEARQARMKLNMGEGTKFYAPVCSGYVVTDNRLELNIGVENGEEVILYVLGETVEAPSWTLVDRRKDDAATTGTMELSNSESLSFAGLTKLVKEGWDEASGVSETDWYNAVVAWMREEGNMITDHGIDSRELRQMLLGWYEYELHLEAGERVVNTVTAPLYPGIDENYDPPVYDYTYLLSPAKTWADFGDLSIEIHSDAYLLESSLKGFEKTVEGYALTLPGLPEGELNFTISQKEQPEEVRSDGDWLMGMLKCLGIVVVISLAFALWGKRKGE